MDRRSFFTRGAGKVAEKLTSHVVEQARKDASRWIRPPFAIEELDFLIACNRCGDCIDACPHNIIFSLPANLGAKVLSTPAMNLNHHGCHMCEDWPCVQACEKQVLKLPVNSKSENTTSEPIYLNNAIKSLKLASVSINTKTCLPYNGPECGACRVCPVEGAMSWKMEKPTINPDICTGCALCREACIVEPKAILLKSKYDT